MRLPKLLSKSENEERAAVLIVSIGILTALFMMGITFVTLQRMESRGARNYLDSVGGKQVSSAVLYYTMERLRFSNSVGSASALYQLGAAYRAYSPPSGLFPEYYSFRYQVPDGDAATQTLSDVRVLDCSSQIYIGGGTGTMNDLQAILEALMTYVDAATFSAASTDAAAIVTASASYITDKLQVKKILDAEKYKLLRDYITVYAPEADDDMRASTQLPLNVNTVSYQVLYAVLKQLVSDSSDTAEAADKLAQRIINNRPYYEWKATPDSTVPGLVDILEAAATETDMLASGYADAAAWKTAREQIIANLLPNAQYSSANLNGYAKVSIGKNNLTSMKATYLSFNSGGLYEILSATRIYASDNTLLSQNDTEAIVRTHRLWHLTTQTDFDADLSDQGNFDSSANVDGNVDVLPEVKIDGNLDPILSTVDGYISLKPANLDPANADFYVSFDSDFHAMNGQLAAADPATTLSADELTVTTGNGDFGNLVTDGVYLGIESASNTTQGLWYPVTDGSNNDNFSTGEGSIDFFVKLAEDVTVDSVVELFYLPFQDGIQSGTANVDGNIDGWDAGIEESDLTTVNTTTYRQFLWWYISGEDMYVRIVGSTSANGDGADNDGDAVIDEADEVKAYYPGDIGFALGGLNLTAGDWHHFMLSWDLDDPTQPVKAYVDNTSISPTAAWAGTPWIINGLKTTVGGEKITHAILGGALRSNATVHPVGTIDEFRFKKSIRTSAGPNGRYETVVSADVVSADYRSPIYPKATDDPLPFGTILGPVTWTEYLPDDGATGADVKVAVWADRENSNFTTAPALTISDRDHPEEGLGDGEPLKIEWASDKLGGRIRIRVSLYDANSPDGANYGGATGTYPNAGAGVGVRDAPIVDDLTLTILPSRPKILLFREVDTD